MASRLDTDRDCPTFTDGFSPTVVMVMTSVYDHTTRKIVGRLVPKAMPAQPVKFDELMK